MVDNVTSGLSKTVLAPLLHICSVAVLTRVYRNDKIFRCIKRISREDKAMGLECTKLTWCIETYKYKRALKIQPTMCDNVFVLPSKWKIKKMKLQETLVMIFTFSNIKLSFQSTSATSAKIINLRSQSLPFLEKYIFNGC